MTWTSWINTVYLSGSLGLTQAFLQLPGVLQTWFSMKHSNYKQGILIDNSIFKKKKERKTESGRKIEHHFPTEMPVVFRRTGPWIQELLWYVDCHTVSILCAFHPPSGEFCLELSQSCCTHLTPGPIPVTLPVFCAQNGRASKMFAG